MKLSFALVAIKKISSAVPASQFDAATVENLAQSILALKGLINPIVVRRTSLTSFEVVSGHLEYYAACRAKEIDIREGEMVQCVILEGDEEMEAAAMTQVAICRSQSAPTETTEPEIAQITDTPEVSEEIPTPVAAPAPTLNEIDPVDSPKITGEKHRYKVQEKLLAITARAKAIETKIPEMTGSTAREVQHGLQIMYRYIDELKALVL